jgi:hypothetical protein
MRAMRGHFTAEKHIGFEAAAWYWHFVDVVWLFLFAPSTSGAAGEAAPPVFCHKIKGIVERIGVRREVAPFRFGRDVMTDR